MKNNGRRRIYVAIIGNIGIFLPLAAHADAFISSGVDTVDGVIFSVDSDGDGPSYFGVQIGSRPDYFGQQMDFSDLSFYATFNSFVSNENTTINGTLTATGATTLSSTLGVSGATSLSSTLGVSGATSLSSTLGVSGATSLSSTLGVSGATSLSSTLGVSGATSLSNTLSVSGATTLSSTLNVAGLTTTNGIANTGTLTSTGNTTLGSAANSVNVIGHAGTSINTLQGAQNTISGVQTSANSTASVMITGQNGNIGMVGPTSVASGQYAGVYIQGAASIPGAYDVYIASQNGQAAIAITNNGVQLISPTLSNGQSATNEIGNGGSNGAGSTLTNNIGLGSTAGGLVNNNIGQSFAGGGAVTNTIGGGAGSSANSFGSVSGNGVATNNIGVANSASSSTTNNLGTGLGNSTNNIGNTNASTTIAMRAGNASSSLANGIATTTLTGNNQTGASVLPNALTSTSGHSGTVLKGAAGTMVAADANGKMLVIVGTAAQTSASMTITNGYGNTHGMYVDESRAVISGGMNSSSFTLNDYGATLSNSATGRPVQLHGVADGTAPFDAVNVQQMDALKQGISGVAAMNNIPSLASDKRANFGVGVGGFDNQTAFALGGNIRVTDSFVVKGSASYGTGANRSNVNTVSWGVGAALSW